MIKRNKKTNICIISGVLCFAGVLVNDNAYAWQKWRDPSGDHLRIYEQKSFRIDRCTMTDEKAIRVIDAVDTWNNPRGMGDMFAYTFKADCKRKLGNGNWEIHGVPSNHEDLNYGKYEGITMCDSNEATGELKECDILFDRGLPYELTDELEDHKATILSVMIHELGHVLGMGHESTKMTIMHESGKTGLFRNATTNGIKAFYMDGLAPDDINYMVKFYPSSNTGKLDAFASAWYWNEDYHYTARIWSYWKDGKSPDVRKVCPGESVDVSFSIGNKGKVVSEAFKYGIYLSSDKNITRSDTRLRSGQVSRNTQFIALMTKSITIPSWVIPGQVYYLGAIVDYDNEHAEDDEYNNAAYLNLNLEILTNC